MPGSKKIGRDGTLLNVAHQIYRENSLLSDTFPVKRPPPANVGIGGRASAI